MNEPSPIRPSQPPADAPSNSDAESGASPSTRREFIKVSATLGAAAMATPLLSRSVFAAGRDEIRVGLIGCGGRGTGAAANCLESSEGVRLFAMGDLFRDRLDQSRQNLEGHGDAAKVPDEHCFSGFDAYEKVLATDVDMVILATPPGFRPMQLEAAIRAGKHVFAEKPIAVDPAGIRQVIAATKLAKEKKLGIVAGTQRRHQESYLETMKRIQDGAIGEVVGGSCYWNQGGLWVHQRQPHYSDMEWQVRNWLYFTWLSGDHIVEQHVHNLDVMNWAMGSPPESAYGMGGRQSRTGAEHGHIYDHFAIELTYPGGRRVTSFSRQIAGSDGRVGESLVGTEGTANPSGRIDGPRPYRYRSRDAANPYVQEHSDLIASIRAGDPLNEGQQIADSTLTAIMGRMSAYTGKVVTREFALSSQLQLLPSKLDFGSLTVPPVAVPGRTKLV